MSEQYRALTRKYRPVNFEDIVSQEHVSSTLKNAIEQNRLAHAYLFCGPRGVGKTTMARVLARTINEVDADVDGEALSNTLNIVEIDAASNNGVDDVRALRERVRIPPQNGRYKVYIIDEVHMLSKAAFNALLKTLEEPPAHAIFIFATTEPHKVLPTILSRCQRFDFRRIKVDEIVDRLKNIAVAEQISIDVESLHVVARKADGALRDALGILDQVIAFCGTDIRHEDVLKALNVVGADILFDLTRSIVEHDSATGMQLVDRVLLDGHDIQEFLIGLTEHFRNLYFAREADNLSLIEASGEMKARYREVSASFSEDDLMRLLHITNEAQYKIREAHQPRIQLEVTVLKLIRMERTAGLAELMREIRTLQSALESNGAGSKSVSESTPGSGGEPGTSRQSPRQTTPAATPASAPPSKPAQAPASTQASAPAAKPAPAPAATPASSPAAKPAPAQTGDSHNLFGAPSINRTQNRLSAVPRDEVTITSRPAGSDQEDVSGLAVSGNLALAAKPRSDIHDTPGLQSDTEADSESDGNQSTADSEKSGDGVISDGNRGGSSESNRGGNPESNHKGNPESNPEGNLESNPEGNNSGNNGGNNNSNIGGLTAPDTGSSVAPAESQIFLHDIKKVWDNYLEIVKTKATPTVFFAMQNTEPVDLKQGELTLMCPDMFAMNLIQENRQVMQECLKNVSGSKIRFRCVLRPVREQDKVAADPYAKFKQLQQADPRIKTIVDLFGAELEY